MGGERYLYAYFHGDEQLDDDQQVRFAISDDALHWKSLHGGRPVLCSHEGDGGVRDPFLIRLPQGGFVLIATDLQIKNPRYVTPERSAWDQAQIIGSHDIVIWRSDDLVHWRGPQFVDVAGGHPIGNVWAPKATFVAERGAYLVYWASTCSNDDYCKNRIYACWSVDFTEFSPMFTLIAREHSCIDAELTRIADGRWVLYMKNESDKTVGIYVSPRLFDEDSTVGTVETGTIGGSAEGFSKVTKEVVGRRAGKFVGELSSVGQLSRVFTRVDQPQISALRGVEGPCAVTRGNDVVLYLDEYMGAKRGYMPFIGDDPTRAASFESSEPSQYCMPDGARHGSVLTITSKEAELLESVYGIQ